jgi:hypothetical protein
MRCNGALLLSLILCAMLAAGCSSSNTAGSPPRGAGYSPFNAGADLPQSHIVAVSVSQTSDSTGVATYQGGQDSASLQWIEVSVNSGPRVLIGSPNTRASVKQSVTLQGFTSGQDHVIAVGHFENLAPQVRRDRDMVAIKLFDQAQ